MVNPSSDQSLSPEDLSIEDRRSFLGHAMKFGAIGAGGVFLINDVSRADELIDPVTGVVSFAGEEQCTCHEAECAACACDPEPCSEQNCKDSCTSCTCGEECPHDCTVNCSCECNCACRCTCACGCGCATGAQKASLDSAANSAGKTPQKDANSGLISSNFGTNLKGPEMQMDQANQDVTDTEQAQVEIKYNSQAFVQVKDQQDKRVTQDQTNINTLKNEEQQKLPGDGTEQQRVASSGIEGAFEVAV